MAFGMAAGQKIVTDATKYAHFCVKDCGHDANDIDLELRGAATTYWRLVSGYGEVYGKFDGV